MAKNDLISPSPSEETYAADHDQGEVFTCDDPFELFAAWLALANKSEPNDANAMALATADADGLPDVRMVLLKDIDAPGLTFHTNTESAKGVQLAANPKAAVCFHWKTIRRQVRFRGAVEPVSKADADAYFATRARGARIGAHASSQSRVMPNESALRRAFEDYEDVPRPDYWSGYRIIPMEIEFWVNRPFRLHDRLVFRRDSAGGKWRNERLYP